MMNRLIRDFDEAALGCRERYELCLQLLDWKDAVTRHRVRFSASRQIRKALAELAQTSGGEESLSLVRIAMLLGAAGAIPQYRAEEIREEQIEYLSRRLEQSATSAQASHNREILENVYRTKLVREDSHMGLFDMFKKKKEEPQAGNSQSLVNEQESLQEQIKEKTSKIRALKIELEMTKDKNRKAMLELEIKEITAERNQLQREFDGYGKARTAETAAKLVKKEAEIAKKTTAAVSVFNKEEVEQDKTTVEVNREIQNEINEEVEETFDWLDNSMEVEEEEEELEIETESEAEEVDEIKEEEENA